MGFTTSEICINNEMVSEGMSVSLRKTYQRGRSSLYYTQIIDDNYASDKEVRTRPPRSIASKSVRVEGDVEYSMEGSLDTPSLAD